MAAEQGFFDGIRGHKRLKTVEKQMERINGEFQSMYADSPEMAFLEEEIQWEETSRLIFTMALRNVHFAWNGLRDHGFLRLCRKWVEQNRINVMTARSTVVMIRSILPVAMCQELGEELAALEIS